MTTGSGVEVTVNGQARRLAPGTTVAEVVASVCGTCGGVAVALGREVVPRSEWDRLVVPEGAAVEVVTAAAGG
jgi:sulfur carrier protein